MKRNLSFVLMLILLFSSIVQLSVYAEESCTDHNYVDGICSACRNVTGRSNLDEKTDTKPELVYLSQVIALRQGDFSNSDGKWTSGDIYGCIVGYELKKGHTISLNDTSFVFSVRKLVNGNYNKIVKNTNSSSFTAAEDMVVAVRVRKTNSAAFTAEELASVWLYDTQYGMRDVPGFAYRFTVDAETITGGIAKTRAAIFLPESYSENGTPTRLVIMTNGLNAHLNDSTWNANSAQNVALIKHYIEAGYAVMVVDNTAQKTKAFDLGNPQLISSYWKAYEHVQEVLNVEEQFSIHSRSQGTFASIRLMRERPELVKCAIMCGPVAVFKNYFAQSKAFVAERFGFDDLTGATYEADKVVGYDPYTDVNGDEYSLPPTFWMMSTTDATASVLTLIQKVQDHGNDVLAAIYDDTDHSGVCTLNTTACWNDALTYLKKHDQVDDEAPETIVVATVNGVEYYTLQEAVDAAKDGDKIILVSDSSGAGVVIDKNVTIDFKGFTYTLTSPIDFTAEGFLLLAENTVVLKNGVINIADSAADKFDILIQNYSNLTLTGMTLDGINLDKYAFSDGFSCALSVNCGNVAIGTTNIIANNDGTHAFSFGVYDQTEHGYTIPIVSMNYGSTVEGKIDASFKIGANTNVGGQYYATFQQAIDAFADDAPSYYRIYVLRDTEGAGVVIDKNITIDFCNHTYTLSSPVGSKGTESNGFQLLAGNNIRIWHGAIKVSDAVADEFYILIQNYANLDMRNMILDGTNLDKYAKTDGDSYTLSVNSGKVSFNGGEIISNNEGDKAFAFDVCDKTSWGYELPEVVIYASAVVDKTKIEAVAMSGNTYYATFQQAIDACKHGGTITLLANVSATSVIVNKTINIGKNGYTISDTDKFVMEEGGKVITRGKVIAEYIES